MDSCVKEGLNPPLPPIKCYGFMEGVKGFRLILRSSRRASTGLAMAKKVARHGERWPRARVTVRPRYLHFFSILHLNLFSFLSRPVLPLSPKASPFLQFAPQGRWPRFTRSSWLPSRSGAAAAVRARRAWAYDAFLFLRDPHRGGCTWLPRARCPSRLPSRSCAIPVAAVPRNPLPVSGAPPRDLRSGGDLVRRPFVFIAVSSLTEFPTPFPSSFCLGL